MMATRPAAILVPTSEEPNVSIDAGENSIANNVNSKKTHANNKYYSN